MKKYTHIIGLLLIVPMAWVAMNALKTSPVVTTGMSIFAEYVDPAYSNSTAVLEEALKTIHAKCNHIFMNKLLWLECIEDLDKNEIMHEWDIYDTHIGLLYLKQKSSTEQIGINIYAFALLEDPFDLDRLNKVTEDAWPYKLAELFDITHWQKYHNNPASKIVVYMNGHGTQRMEQLEDQLACGIRASSFAQVLTFLHDKLQINLLGIQSCFWTTERIHELLKQLGYEYPRFTVLSPLSSEEGLWLDTINNYLRKKDTCHCFFDCCMSFTATYQETITDEIKDIINNTDTLQLDGNKHQRATLLAAGTNQLVTV